MQRTLIYTIYLLLGLLISCSKEECAFESNRDVIQVEVAGVNDSQTRVGLYDSETDIVNDQEFALEAYLADSNNTPYIEKSAIRYFNGDWRFKDNVNEGNLINYYWPNDNQKVNFIAYLPQDLDRCVVKREDISFNRTTGFSFTVDMPTTIEDVTQADRDAENGKKEFIYACRLNQDKENGTIKLRFVHPFAVVSFRVSQGHRNLVLHNIALSGLATKGTFKSNEDTYYRYGNDHSYTGQEYLTCANWDNFTRNTLKINLDKIAPGDIDYGSLIGGPYLVIPQNLDDVKLKINYSWDTYENQSSGEFAIKSETVSQWRPGYKYTYYLDLGDNKEEILFKVEVEEWKPGEDEGFENNIDVQ